MGSLKDELSSAGFKPTPIRPRRPLNKPAYELINEMWSDEKKKKFVIHLVYAFANENVELLKTKPGVVYQCAICRGTNLMGEAELDNLIKTLDDSALRETADFLIKSKHIDEASDTVKQSLEKIKEIQDDVRVAKTSSSSDAVLCEVCHKALLQWAMLRASSGDPDMRRVARRIVYGTSGPHQKYAEAEHR